MGCNRLLTPLRKAEAREATRRDELCRRNAACVIGQVGKIASLPPPPPPQKSVYGVPSRVDTMEFICSLPIV